MEQYSQCVLATIVAALVMAACIPMPGGGDKISDEALAPIEVGKATRGDVEAALGKPTIIWETERIWVYEQGPSGAILWIVPGGYSAAIFLLSLIHI
mgnify:CR=1 FL=1